MNIKVIDCDEDRRILLVEFIRRLTTSASVIGFGSLQALFEAKEESGGTPLLVVCHVGDRQQAEERGKLAIGVQKLASEEHTIVAGFTGGAISSSSLSRMPLDSPRFAINYAASAGEIPMDFARFVTNLVKTWLFRGGRLDSIELSESWLGVNPALEAKLCLLSSALQGEENANYGRWRETLGLSMIVDEELSEAKLKELAAMELPQRLKGLRNLRDRLFGR